MMTVLEVLQSSADYFKKHKVDDPRLNAEHLLAHVLGRKRIELYLEFERPLIESELAPLRQLVRRRGTGEPLQHLLGTVEFCGHVFVCDKRAMVPRPETEELVELLIAECGLRNAERIIDVGTGSGVIALSLATKFPQAKIHAVDVSESALGLARENTARLGLNERVQLTKSDLLAHVDGTFDVVAANLPYISTGDGPSLSREVLHDPEVALFGGERGDELVLRLIEEAPAHLKPGGLLALELGFGQVGRVSSALASKKYKDIESKSDYSGRPRFVFARYG